MRFFRLKPLQIMGLYLYRRARERAATLPKWLKFPFNSTFTALLTSGGKESLRGGGLGLLSTERRVSRRSEPMNRLFIPVLH